MIIGLISDIHEDIVSLRKAINYLNSIKVDEIVCLGDITGYSDLHYYPIKETRNASECIKVISENCKYVVGGNHDYFSARQIPVFKAGFTYPDNWYLLKPSERKKLSANKLWFYEDEEIPGNLNDDDLIFLSGLPEFKIIDNILLSHFIYPDLSGATMKFPKSKRFFKNHLNFQLEKSCDISFCGHAHYGGIALATRKKFNILAFGTYKIDSFPCCVSLPCIANCAIINGVTIFDTNTYELKVQNLSDN
ncbi:MAG: metallophosphoesterase [Bacteroidota bacterium]